MDGDDLFVGGGGFVGEAEQALAFADAEGGEVVQVGGDGVVAQRLKFRDGEVIEGAAVEAVGKQQALLGVHRDGRTGEREGDQQRGARPAYPGAAFHGWSGTPVANEMFQMSAWRQRSSTRIT